MTLPEDEKLMKLLQQATASMEASRARKGNYILDSPDGEAEDVLPGRAGSLRGAP